MLSGAPPFQAPTPAETLARIVSERPPALGGFRRSSPPSTGSSTVRSRASRTSVSETPRRWRRTSAPRCVSPTAVDSRRRSRSGGSSCCRSGCCARIPRSTSSPSAWPTRLPRRSMGESRLVVRSSLAAARYAGGRPGRGGARRRGRRRSRHDAARCSGRAIRSASPRSWPRRRGARSSGRTRTRPA